MIRFTRNLSIVALLLVLPVAASALSISAVSVSSSGTSALEAGDILTVDLRVDNSTSDSVFGLGIVAVGHDADADGVANSGLSFLGADLGTGSILNSVYFPIPNIDGLQNTLPGAAEFGGPHPISPDELWVSLFQGVTFTAATGDGTADNGVAGTQTGLGDVHFRVRYLVQDIDGASAASPVPITLTFGTSVEFGAGAIGTGGSPLAFNNASVTVNVVPEPGTALLMGLGLASLAIRRR